MNRFKKTEKPAIRILRTVASKGFLLVAVFFCITLQAQVETVTGQITDAETGEPLLGVNILEKGTANGVASDFDGNYSIEVGSSDAVLVFSFLGYETTEMVVGSQTKIDLSLGLAANQLDEFVVVAYGKKKKRNLTGSVVSVGGEDIEQTNLQDPVSILQGRAAGVQVISNSGAPGGGMTIRVRGNSSLNSGNSPLY